MPKSSVFPEIVNLGLPEGTKSKVRTVALRRGLLSAAWMRSVILARLAEEDAEPGPHANDESADRHTVSAQV